MGMGKSFPTQGFPIPIPLNLLWNRVGNRGEIYNGVGNEVGLPTLLSFIKKFEDNEFIILLLDVDDMLVAGPNKDRVQELKA